MGILPNTFTVTVTNGVDVEVTAGDALSAANCAEGFPVAINGQVSFVSARVDTTHFTLLTAVTNGAGLPCAISTLTSREISNATLNQRVVELVEQLNIFESGSGLGINAFGLFAERTNYDDRAENFVFLSLDGDGAAVDAPVMFVKQSSTVADWSAAISVRASIAEILAELGVTGITVSTLDPSGGNDGDLWFKVPA